MIAKLADLKGKYYGTKVLVGPYEREISIWLTFSDDPLSYIPSDRELLGSGLTREQWDNDVMLKIADDVDGELYYISAREHLPACDHFEDQYSYITALKIVEALNKEEQNG